MKNLKKYVSVTLSIITCLSLCSCGKAGTDSRLGQGNQVENAVNEKMKEEDKTKTENAAGTTATTVVATTEEATVPPMAVVTTEQSSETTEQSTATTETASGDKKSGMYDIPEFTVKPEDVDYDNVDIDVTQMDSSMVYATVYHMVYNPKEYVGKTVKINGKYSVAYSNDPGNDNTYHYCIVNDAQQCCSQGIEFVCNDGHDVYPDDFPANEEMIEVTGVLEMYREGDYTYIRLNYAHMNPDPA